MQAETAQSHPHRLVLFIRALIWWLIFFVTTVLFTVPVLLGLLVSYKFGYGIVKWWVWVNMKTLRFICRINWHVTGTEHIPDEPYLLMSKHQSTFETLVMPDYVKDPVFVSKKELAYVPFFGWCLAMADSILIKRGSGRSAIKQLVEQAKARFERGRNVIIFPEGTRREPGAEPVYRIGGAVVAAELDVPIVPMAHNAGEYWPRHSFIKWPGTIEIRFGPPIQAQGRKPDEILAEVVDWIEARQDEITVLNRFPY